MRRLLIDFLHRFVGLSLTAFALIHAPTATVAAESIFGLVGDRLYNFDVASGQATGRVNLVNEVGTPLTTVSAIAFSSSLLYGLVGDRLYNFDVASGQATGRVNLVNEVGTPLTTVSAIAFLPVAEPAPMTVLATALACLIAVRCRNRRPMLSHV